MNTGERTHLLIADDDPLAGKLAKQLLEAAGYEADYVDCATALWRALAARHYAAIALDLYFGRENGIELMPEIRRRSPGTRVLMLTGLGTLDSAVRAMRAGASGFLPKSELVRLGEEIDGVLNANRTVSRGKDRADSLLVGESAAFGQLRALLRRMATVDSTVLVTGESGTGKELAARTLHVASPRAAGPFVAINCAAIPESILEAQLFGSAKGAFTDAKVDRPGIFEACNGGTLFLDEIGEMSMACQAKLLRVVQEREVTRLGSVKAIPIDTRLIAATNRDLLERCNAGAFREDLYYRLSVLTVAMPPLRTRREDIPGLVCHFIDKLNERMGRSVRYPDAGLLARLSAQEWRGNVRELQNVIERAVALVQGDILEDADLFPDQPVGHAASKAADRPAPVCEYRTERQSFERDYVARLVERTGSNVSEASRLSGLPRSHVYRLFARVGTSVSPRSGPRTRGKVMGPKGVA